jgi:hypothetical protein
MLSMRGFIPVCIIIQPEFILDFKEKNLWTFSFNSQWMKKWKAEAGGNQFLHKTAVKADNKFNYAFRGNIVTVV